MKNRGNEIDVIVKNNDDSLKVVSKEFIDAIETEFSKYQENYKKNKEIDERYKGKEGYYFIPEKLTKKSPLTILDAPWGSGKTYFIENLLKLLLDKKIESNTFKRMIIIDAWKFSNSKDVPLEFIVELSEILLKINGDTLDGEGKKKFIGKMLKKLAPTSMSFQFNIPFFSVGANKEFISKEDEEKVRKALGDVKENEVPTLLFIDNLERLGSLSWDLLKTVIKMQEFSNFLIVLPLNLNKIKNNDRVDNSEYPIEKYIDIALFNFKQDYYGYFSEKIKDEYEANIFNDIFLEEIDGEKLSIREVEQSIRKNNVLSLNTTYEKIKVIYKEIWPADKTIGKILSNDVEFFVSKMKEQSEIIETIYSKTSVSDEEGLINILSSEEYEENNIINFNDYSSQNFNFDINYSKDIEYLQHLIKNKEEYLEEEINKNQTQIQLNDHGIIQENKNIEKQNKDIEEFEKRMEKENEKIASERDAQTITENNANVQQANAWIGECNDNKKRLSEEKDLLIQRNSSLSQVKKHLFLDIENYKNKYLSNQEKVLNVLGEEKITNIIKYIHSIPGFLSKFSNDIAELMSEVNLNIINIIK